MKTYNPIRLYIKEQKDIISEFEKIGADPGGIKLMAPKGEVLLIRAEHVSLKAANLLKQEMLSRGGDCVVHRNVSNLTIEESAVILIGTRRTFQGVLPKLRSQPFGLKALGKEIETLLYNETKSKEPQLMTIRGKVYDWNAKTWIMGILNVTPDSFSDGGKFNQTEYAVAHAKEMVANGADIIDIGGESNRPGHEPVSLEQELARVVPIIEALRTELPDVPISIDTYKAKVAEEAVKAGADIINDIWGAKQEPAIAEVAAKYQVPIILMHNRTDKNYEHLMSDIASDIRESIAIAKEAGVTDAQIILDPGIGFAKTYEQNLEVMRKLDTFTALGYPVLLGTSRKSMIGNALDLPVTERMEGTGATVCLGIEKGCQIMRVHDVKEMSRMAKMMDIMLGRRIDG